MIAAFLAFVTALTLGIGAQAGPASPPPQNQPTQDAGPALPMPPLQGARILVFTKTAGFRHGSINAGVESFKQLAKEQRFDVVQTEDARDFSASKLEKFDAVVFLNTTGDVLDESQQNAFQQYIQTGGGYLGIHAASDTEFEWDFYGDLVGAYFAGHPRVQEATINVDDHKHPATMHLSATWIRTDEWYNFKQPPKDVRVLLSLDTSSYEGSSMGESHPIAWCKELGEGRSLYTGGGHTNQSFQEPAFRRHLVGALVWVTHREPKADAQPVPSDPS